MKVVALIQVLAVLCITGAFSTAAGPTGTALAADGSVTSVGQIEADWLRQEELRERPGLGTPAARYVNVKPEQDAAGGCDGVKDGKWGFHTENEKNPWWQVDLGKPTPLDRLAALQPLRRVRPSATRGSWSCSPTTARPGKQVYQHNGTVVLRPDRQEAAGGEARRGQGPLRPPATARQELLPPRRGRDLSGRRATRTSPWASRPRRAAPASGRRRSTRERRPRRHSRRPTATYRHRPKAIERGPEAGRRPAAARRRRSTPRCRRSGRPPSGCQAAPPRTPRPRPSASSTSRPAGPCARMALANPLLGLRHDPLRQARAGPLPAHVRPVLRLVVAARRRRLRPRRLQEPTAAAPLPDRRLARGQLPAARPVLRRQEGPVRLLQVLPAAWPTMPNKADKANLPEDAFYHVFEMNLDGSGRAAADPRPLRRLRRPLPAQRRHRVPLDAQGAVPPVQQGQHGRPTDAGRPARQLRALRRRQLPARARLHAARDGRRRREPAADLGLRELRVDARRWPTTAASSTPAGTTSTASTATS